MKLLKPAHIPMRLAPIFLGAAIALGACNADKSEEPPYEPAVSVAVQGFSLTANSKVLANLDSVYFSIDLDHAVIFNADSLPVGTAIDKLVANITFPAAVTSATIEMTDGKTRTGVIDYKESPKDSIDFTGNVRLILATEDNALSQTYTLKVNVHKMVADSLMWDKAAIAPLPSAAPQPKEQRTVTMADRTLTLVAEADGSYTMAQTAEPASASWQLATVSFPFTPQVRTLTATSQQLYILADTGDLYTSADGSQWSATGANWTTLIGAFGDAVLGIRPDAGRYYHDTYPRPASYTAKEIPADFPVDGLSNFNTFTSAWTTEPIGNFTGGERQGRVYGDTWAYDGYSWAKISNTPLPEMQDLTVVPYFNYRQTATSWIQTEFSVLLALGGRKADGSVNRTVYLSYDNGVNWMKAESLLQLPNYVPSFYAADAVVSTTRKEASLGAHWQNRANTKAYDVRRIHYFVDGSDVEWDCPYIYLYGGMDASGHLNPQVWRAVLARLTFAPLF
ncbi:MAG: hypothetical protein K2N19_07630 [Muribaculaceae bacterium]|nr:hypothetical protein [Muribaculaceae bacterium]